MVRTVVVAVLGLAAGIAAQRDRSGVVDGGGPFDAAVRRAAPEWWGTVLAAQQGKVVFANGYGMADHAARPNTPRTLFDAGGLCNHFTNAAVLLLCSGSERKHSLDDAIGSCFEGWPADKAALTLRQFVEHRSGLRAEFAWQDGEAVSLRGAIARWGRTEFGGTVGEVSMSLHNGAILAGAIERAARTGFEQFLHKRLFVPAGMVDSGLCGEARLDQARQSRRRSANLQRDEDLLAFGMNWAHRGERGLVTTVHDLHAWLAWLTAGRALAPDAVAMLLTPIEGGEPFSVRSRQLGGVPLVELRGATSGYRSRVLLHAPSRSWVVLLGGEHDGIDAVADAVAAGLVAAPGRSEPAAAPPGPPAPNGRSLAAGVAERFCGLYSLPGGAALWLAEQQGGLRLFGLGAQGSVRTVVGHFDAAMLARCEEQGATLANAVDALRARQVREARRFFAGDDAFLAAQETWRELGDTAGGTWWLAAGADRETGHALWFGKTPRWVQVAFDAEARLRRLAPADVAPAGIALEFVRPDVLQGSAGAHRLLLTIEGLGAGRCLVFEDATPGGEGLLECPLLRAN